MAQHRITCTIQVPYHQPHSHAHISQVGIGNETGWSHMLTVQQVYAAMDAGDIFYTFGIQSGKMALVHKLDCPFCGRPTLRSAPDAVLDNNLDNLPRCGQ